MLPLRPERGSSCSAQAHFGYSALSTSRPGYSACRRALRWHGLPFLGPPTVRLALSAPTLAGCSGRVSTAATALLQRNSTRTFHAAWTSEYPSMFPSACHYYLRDTRLGA